MVLILMSAHGIWSVVVQMVGGGTNSDGDTIIIIGTVLPGVTQSFLFDINMTLEEYMWWNMSNTDVSLLQETQGDQADAEDENTPEEEAEEQGIDLKDGVEIDEMTDEMQDALDEIADAWSVNAEDITPVITSGNEGTDGDGVHGTGSLHYSGDAVDLRTNNLTQDQVDSIVSDLSTALGNDYDVIDEGDHIHLEYDPEG